MPELPEVETVRTGLEAIMVGKRVARVEARRPDLRYPLPVDMGARLSGRRVDAITRRAKYLIFDFEGEHLIAHLGMSGRYGPLAGAPQKHDHVLFHVENGPVISYHDPRRFGAMDLAEGDPMTHKWLAHLGPEPLGNGFHAGVLMAQLKGRRVPLRTALLDQRNVVGVGNIYVAESLWRAGIDPMLMAGELTEADATRLVVAIRDVLAAAIDAGGSSLRDHRQTSGELGYFQHDFNVYGRAGQPCRRAGCEGEIARATVSGRSSFFCPECQTRA